MALLGGAPMSSVTTVTKRDVSRSVFDHPSVTTVTTPYGVSRYVMVIWAKSYSASFEVMSLPVKVSTLATRFLKTLKSFGGIETSA
jgi:hypothetical protein